MLLTRMAPGCSVRALRVSTQHVLAVVSGEASGSEKNERLLLSLHLRGNNDPELTVLTCHGTWPVSCLELTVAKEPNWTGSGGLMQ